MAAGGEGDRVRERGVVVSCGGALVKKVVFDEVQCSPHEFHNPVLDVCET